MTERPGNDDHPAGREPPTPSDQGERTGTGGRRRRTVLKTGLAVAGALGIGTSVSTPARAATTVSGGGGALQAAVDAASEGDTLVVTDSATYDPVTVDVGVTVEATADPTVAGEGGLGAAVTVAADDVTLDGLRVTNAGGLIGIKVDRGYDGTTVEDCTVEDVGPTGRLGVTGIVVGQGPHEGIRIENNAIRDLDQETTPTSRFPTANGILFDADNADPATLSDSAVANNEIRGIESDVAPLGVVIQHATEGVAVANNEIRELTAADDTDSDPSDGVDFEFTFAQGINVASPSTTDTVIARNTIAEVTSAETILPEAVKVDGDGGGLTLRANQFLVAIGVNNRNGTDGGSRDPSNDPVVDARNNWWGDSRGPEEAAFNQDADDDDRSDVVGAVRYEPALPTAPGPGAGSQGP